MVFCDRKIIPLLFFTIVCTPLCDAKEKIDVGDVPPNYLGRDRQGEKVYVDAYKGKVVVVTFWASWCAPCRKEMTVLEKIQKIAGKEKIEVVGVNFKEERGKFKKILRVLKDVKITLTHDPRGIIGRKFGVKNLPRMFIINQEGKVTYTHEGYSEKIQQGFVQELNHLLRE